MSNKVFSLSSINKAIKRQVDEATGGRSFWIKAEISSINLHKNSGHWYLELAETLENKTLAKIRAMIWSSTAKSIHVDLKDSFEKVLSQGSEIVFRGKVDFHLEYGLSINIQEIDLDFTLGQIERRKKEAYEKLKKENLLNKNASIKLNPVIKHILLFASDGTAGYKDFVETIINNSYDYKIYIWHKSIQVQGNGVSERLAALLKRASDKTETYDAIVILRGGGSKLDLDPFNHYELCKEIALSKIPVFTGIGHEVDTHNADHVSHTEFKTPTAIGEYIINHNYTFERSFKDAFIKVESRYRIYREQLSNTYSASVSRFKERSISYTRLRRGNLHNTGSKLIRAVKDELSLASNKLNESKPRLESGAVKVVISRAKAFQELSKNNLATNSKSILTNYKIAFKKLNIQDFSEKAKHNIAIHRRKMVDMNALIDIVSPVKTARRGFGILRRNNKILKKTDVLNPNDKIEVSYYDKKIEVNFGKNIES